MGYKINVKLLGESFCFHIFAEMVFVMENTSSRIIIKNPPKKVLDFVMKMQKEKEAARKRLLEKDEHTFSIQM